MDDSAKIRQPFSTGQHSKREIGRLVEVSQGMVDRALEADRFAGRDLGADGGSVREPATRCVEARLRCQIAHRRGWQVIAYS